RPLHAADRRARRAPRSRLAGRLPLGARPGSRRPLDSPAGPRARGLAPRARGDPPAPRALHARPPARDARGARHVARHARQLVGEERLSALGVVASNARVDGIGTYQTLDDPSYRSSFRTGAAYRTGADYTSSQRAAAQRVPRGGPCPARRFVGRFLGQGARPAACRTGAATARSLRG